MQMLRLLHRWRFWVAVCSVFILIGLIYTTAAGRRHKTPVEEWVGDALAPLEAFLTAVTRGTAHWMEIIRRYDQLLEENRRLRQEVASLRSQNRQVDYLRRENETLREALGFAHESDYPLLAAEIIARSPSNWFEKIVLNRGRADGLRPGDPVLAPAGVVGRVHTVTNHTAEIMLVTDSRSAFGGTVVRTGDPVLVEGRTGRPGYLQIKPLVREADIQMGDEIVTSAMSGVFPAGIPVGVIEEVNAGEYGLLQTGVLRPYVDFNHIQVVFVVQRSEAKDR